MAKHAAIIISLTFRTHPHQPTIPPPPTLNQPRLIRRPNTYYAVSWLLCVVYLVDAMVSIIAQLIVVCNHLHDGCKWRKYLSPKWISTKPSASNITQGMWMTIVHSTGSSPRHRPSNLLITHAYRKQKTSIYTMVVMMITILLPDGFWPNQVHTTSPMVCGWSGAKQIGGGNATGHE